MIRKQDKKFVVFSISPVMIIMFTLLAGPLFYSIYLSLHSFNLTMPSSMGIFIGLENFKTVIENPLFFKSLRITLVYSFITVILELIIGLFIVTILSKLVKKVQVIILGLIIIPWSIPGVVNGLMWRWILNPYYGVLNGVLYSLGFTEGYIPLLSYPNIAMGAIINAQIWRQLPLVIYLLFAGLQSIPKDVLEAAVVDGASPFKTFFNITIPFLKPTISILLIIQTMESLRAFDTIWVITGGGPGTATYVIAWLTYSKAFREFEFGQSSALSLIILVIILIFASTYIRLLKQKD
ncbi:MAG: sugar ABC transporter permease [Actinomycetia bacterium]|nr:sugar ABC transporter permease [Actinomycetes bacterium]